MTLADFCPYVQEFTWKSEDKTSRGTRCTDYSNQPSDDNNYALGAKYLFCFSSRSLKMREKYISFAQFVYFLREVCLLFNF